MKPLLIVFGMMVAGVGGCLILASELHVLEEHVVRKSVVVSSVQTVDPALENQLVYVTGAASGDGVKDPSTGLAYPGLALFRILERRGQLTREVRTGKTWTMKTSDVWMVAGTPLAVPEGFYSESFFTSNPRLGQRRLDARFILLLPRVDVPLPVELEKRLPAILQPHGKSPQLGDFRLRYEGIPAGPVTAIARQTGAGFTDWFGPAHIPTLLVRALKLSLPDILAHRFRPGFDALESVRWAIAMVCALGLLWMGAVAMSSGLKLERRSSVIFSVELTLLAAAIAVMRWNSRPGVSLAVLFGVVLMWWRRSVRSAPPSRDGTAGSL